MTDKKTGTSLNEGYQPRSPNTSNVTVKNPSGPKTNGYQPTKSQTPQWKPTPPGKEN